VPLFQIIISFIIFISFFLALLIIAWYIAIPLVIIWLIFGGLKWIQMRLLTYRQNRQANGCMMRRTRKPFREKATVIDVDYTELD